MMKTDVRGNLNVKAVSQLSGVSSHTLRAWERRYKAVTPQRLENGRRVYTLQDVERLKVLRDLVERGHTISSVAKLAKDELENLLNLKLDSGESIPHLTPEVLPDWGDKLEAASIAHAKGVLTQALREFRLDVVGEELLRSRTLFNVRTFILEIVTYLLAQVEIGVKNGMLTSAQEAAFAAVLREQLNQVLKTLNFQNKSPMKVALATRKGDVQEFGILLSAILCVTHGLGIHYLGPNLSHGDLAQAVLRGKAPLLILGTTKNISPVLDQESLPQYLTELDQELPADAELWIGGEDADSTETLKMRRVVRQVTTLNKLDQFLYGIGNASALRA